MTVTNAINGLVYDWRCSPHYTRCSDALCYSAAAILTTVNITE